MEQKVPFKLTREKHLDHMVRVVPFIVFGFAIHCYILGQISPALGTGSIIFLGCCLAIMIGAFITYDVKHQVTFYEDHLEMSFLGMYKEIPYSKINRVDISETNQTFASLIIWTQGSSHRFFFVDDADKVREFLLNSKTTFHQEAA